MFKYEPLLSYLDERTDEEAEAVASKDDVGAATGVADEIEGADDERDSPYSDDGEDDPAGQSAGSNDELYFDPEVKPQPGCPSHPTTPSTLATRRCCSGRSFSLTPRPHGALGRFAAR